MAIAAWLMPACFVVLPIEQLDRVAVLLGPVRVHPQQHLGPVVGVGAAVAGVDREDRAGASCGPLSSALSLSSFDERLRAASTSPGTSAANDSSSLGHFDHRGQIVAALDRLVERLEHGAEAT